MKIIDSKIVVDRYASLRKLQTNNIEKRGWLLDILSCTNAIPGNDFSLKEMYQFADELQSKHVENHNINAKIRQQLQILRDKGFIEFLGNGHYRKIINWR